MLMSASRDIFILAEEAYARRDVETARKIEPLNDVIRYMCDDLKHSHVERLTAGICGAEQGFVYNDILTSCARIGGHSMNIAAIIIRVSQVQDDIETSEYLHSIKHRNDADDEKLMMQYFDKYGIKIRH